MSIRIGHASIDENGKAKGGAAGDQNGKEVCIRTWYSKPWGLMLRYPDAVIAEKAAQVCEAGCANSNIGYDQIQRNTAHTLALANGYKISELGKCETDCSAFMTLCYLAAGVFALEYAKNGNAPTTSTMKTVFAKAGFQVYTDSKYLTGTDYLKRGDILVKPGSHTVMVLDNGKYATTTTTTTTTTAKNNGIDKSIAGKYLTTTDLNMRDKANTDGKVVTVIKKNNTVQCYGYSSTDSRGVKWLYVAYGNKVGYVSTKYLKKKE